MNRTCTLAGTLLLLLLAPTFAMAQTSNDDDWQFRASVYGFFPKISGEVKFPTGQTRDITIDADTLLDNTKVVAMGAFELQKRRWGAFVDTIYMNVGTTKTATRQLAIEGVPVPVDVTANADVDIKAPVITMATNFRVASTPVVTFDVFGGARFLAAKATLDWEFSTEIGGIGGPSRIGTSEVKNHVWDGIGGAKGRIRLGPNSRVFIPFYADAGAGQSDFTWQAMAGLGYAFGWGEVIGGWRHLEYDLAPDKKFESLSFDGPIAGIAFRW